MKKNINKAFWPLVLSVNLLIAQTTKVNDLKKGVSYTCTNVSFSEFSYWMKSKIGEIEFSFQIDKPEIVYGNKFTFSIDKLTGLKEKDGKVQLLISLKINDKEGKTVLNSEDIYGETNTNEGGMDAESVKKALRLFITVASPMKINQEYEVGFVVKDKLGDGEIKGNLKLKTTQLDASAYEVKNITSDGPIFLTMPGKNILNGHENPIGIPTDAQKIYCLFNGMKDWKLQNGKVIADASIKLTDDKGTVLLESLDLFKTYNDAGGIDPKEVEDVPLSVSLGDPMEKEKTYKAEFILKDKISKGFVKTIFNFKWDKK